MPLVQKILINLSEYEKLLEYKKKFEESQLKTLKGEGVVKNSSEGENLIHINPVKESIVDHFDPMITPVPAKVDQQVNIEPVSSVPIDKETQNVSNQEIMPAHVALLENRAPEVNDTNIAGNTVSIEATDTNSKNQANPSPHLENRISKSINKITKSTSFGDAYDPEYRYYIGDLEYE